ncbi:MAG: YraN family protein [Peptococcaceae bacterium]|nr:YraN family protein [Peptococcaceae bacterium]
MDYQGLTKKELGDLGESLAADYLEKAGLQIIARNYRCPKGEIDIIARDGEHLVFIEVRTKTSGIMGYAEESIDRKKMQKIRGSAAYYVMERGYLQWPSLGIDLLAIYLEKTKYTVNWIRGIV